MIDAQAGACGGRRVGRLGPARRVGRGLRRLVGNVVVGARVKTRCAARGGGVGAFDPIPRERLATKESGAEVLNPKVKVEGDGSGQAPEEVGDDSRTLRGVAALRRAGDGFDPPRRVRGTRAWSPICRVRRDRRDHAGGDDERRATRGSRAARNGSRAGSERSRPIRSREAGQERASAACGAENSRVRARAARGSVCMGVWRGGVGGVACGRAISSMNFPSV